MREGWIQNDEGGRMMISSWWGVLITDRLTDKRTFVNVDTENYCIEPPHTRAQFMPIWNQTACELLILLIQYNILLDVTLDSAISLVNISDRESSPISNWHEMCLVCLKDSRYLPCHTISTWIFQKVLRLSLSFCTACV